VNTRALICSAIAAAMGPKQMLKYEGLTGGKLHRAMSQNFVRLFAKSLRSQYPAEAKIAVMSKDIGGHRLDFGMNELLFDIAVFEWDTTSAIASKKKELQFATKGLLIVESEMAKDSRAALHDFNKLILGNAQNKLFIGPLVAKGAAYRKTLEGPARHCTGQLQLAAIQHPRDWSQFASKSVELWAWDCEQWQRVFDPAE